MASHKNRKKLKYKEAEFDRKEFIVSMQGMHGNLLDYFSIVTNKGKKVKFGEYGGTETLFDLKIPKDHYVLFLKGGYGGHIHHLGCYSTEINCSIKYQYTYSTGDSLEQSKTEGCTHDDTKVYSNIKDLK